VRCYSPWARWGLGAASGLLFVVSVAVTWGFAASGWNVPMVTISLFLVSMLLLAGCLTAASIWNTVRVEVIAGDVVIESGPVPWRTRRSISGGSIEQLYVQQAPLERPFWLSFGGRIDVKARLRNGRWVTIVAGCMTEHDARRIERRVECVLNRRDEYGEIDDDERSEVFADWRESLGPTPWWLDVQQQGDLVNIRYRDPIVWQLIHVVIGGVIAAAGVWLLARLSTFGFDAALCSVVVLCGATHTLGAIIRRRTIIVNATHIARCANWPVWNRRQIAVERDLVKSLDCRSRTITRHGSKGARWRYRRYWIVACHAVLGHFRLTEDVRTRGAALHLMNAIGEALRIGAEPTPWADGVGAEEGDGVPAGQSAAEDDA